MGALNNILLAGAEASRHHREKKNKDKQQVKNLNIQLMLDKISARRKAYNDSKKAKEQEGIIQTRLASQFENQYKLADHQHDLRMKEIDYQNELAKDKDDHTTKNDIKYKKAGSKTSNNLAKSKEDAVKRISDLKAKIGKLKIDKGRLNPIDFDEDEGRLSSLYKTYDEQVQNYIEEISALESKWKIKSSKSTKKPSTAFPEL